MARAFLQNDKRLYKINIQSKPLYNIIERFAKISIIGVQLSTTGKKVEKRLVASNHVLKTWNTIAKAAESEGFSTAKMSRSVKDKTVFKDYYYCVAV
jgi:hypothetical protein